MSKKVRPTPFRLEDAAPVDVVHRLPEEFAPSLILQATDKLPGTRRSLREDSRVAPLERVTRSAASALSLRAGLARSYARALAPYSPTRLFAL